MKKPDWIKAIDEAIEAKQRIYAMNSQDRDRRKMDTVPMTAMRRMNEGAIDYWKQQAFTMAAGQCCVKSGGLMADDHGHQYCDMERQRDELKRDLAAAQEALQRDNEGWQRTYDHDCAKLVERAQRAEDIAQIKAWQLLDSEESKKRAEALAESYRKALLHERTALATVRDRQCHDGVCAISLADIEKGIALLDAAIAGEKP